MILLVKLIAAHLLGDFTLQSATLRRMKESSFLLQRFAALTVHSLIQGILTYIFIGDWSNWLIPVIISISHFIIDVAKISISKEGFISMIVDQLTHFIVLLLIYWWVIENSHHTYISNLGESMIPLPFWLVATSYIAILSPSSILIKNFMDYEKWIPADPSLKGLPNAGKWIGYLERILILTFIFTKNVEGIGFLLAAKSIFRFGELNRAKDIKVTEYVLIGTFASFSIAIIIGFGVQWLFLN